MDSTHFDSVSPIEPLGIENGLTLLPRVRLTLAVHPTNLTHTKPVDDWQLKRSLLDFLKNSLTVSLTVPEEDLQVARVKDLKKHKRDEPLALGSLVIRDLGFLIQKKGSSLDEVEKNKEDAARALEKKYLDLRRYLVGKMDGLELNFGGVKFRLSAAIPVSDDFNGMRKEWEEHYAFGKRGYSRGGKQEPDTIVLRGVPSRWFAEPRVSSKPSMLVTHTIFSTFGSVRNISVAEDNEFGQDADEDGAGLVSGLHCKTVVQFEKYKDFYNALKMLCARSMQKWQLKRNILMHERGSALCRMLVKDKILLEIKQGSRLKADYEVSWDKDGFFRGSRFQNQDKSSRSTTVASGQNRSEASRRHVSHYSPENSRPKRFKE